MLNVFEYLFIPCKSVLSSYLRFCSPVISLPVSYTHLDVYKRQELNNQITRISDIEEYMSNKIAEVEKSVLSVDEASVCQQKYLQ